MKLALKTNNKKQHYFDRKVLRQVVWKERVFTYFFEKNYLKHVFIAEVIISYCSKENALLKYMNYSPPPSSPIQPVWLSLQKPRLHSTLLPACLPACQPAFLHSCLPACPSACLHACRSGPHNCLSPEQYHENKTFSTCQVSLRSLHLGTQDSLVTNVVC